MHATRDLAQDAGESTDRLLTVACEALASRFTRHQHVLLAYGLGALPPIDGEPVPVELTWPTPVTVAMTFALSAELNQWTLAHNGAFVLFEFPKAAPIVNLEHYRSSAFLNDLNDSKDVNEYANAVTTLRETAMSLTDSVKLITSCMDEMEAFP